MTDEPTLTQVLDGLATLHSRFDDVDARFDGVDTRFDRVDQRLDVLETRFTLLVDRQAHITDHLGSVEGRLDLLTAESALFRREVGERFESLDRVVGGLDRDVQALTARVLEWGQSSG
ncbi:MAG TPA: hypothetical protein VLM05_12280 [Mycobacteriales bacterium]|nr:hypothetical protein [Mycobacteriales bacterium]